MEAGGAERICGQREICGMTRLGEVLDEGKASCGMTRLGEMLDEDKASCGMTWLCDGMIKHDQVQGKLWDDSARARQACGKMHGMSKAGKLENILSVMLGTLALAWAMTRAPGGHARWHAHARGRRGGKSGTGMGAGTRQMRRKSRT
ncbi:hypothetical protein HAX54_007346 [Datura stramonium]|uniref:Uncharacterized protein n=1 Tax=Datura stramonium TaxID=4076 RepID=A0ABS8YAR6_DATST|nr:hypothetical protein [Datura stramonium]